MKNRKNLWIILAGIALLLAVMGVTSAWLVNRSALTTLFPVLKPDTITISNTDGTEMTEIDLDYVDGVDTKDPDGTIHIRRAFCIKSSSPLHRLEIVHTTNLESLTFSIYPASIDQKPVAEATPLTGSYGNEDGTGTLTAKAETLDNYQATADVADVHAYPLYWLAQLSATAGHEPADEPSRTVQSYTKKEFDVSAKAERDFYFTNYICEISWKETTKETDLFYIMAQSVAV
ncbi:MAG: hypothetical protein Q4B59_00630 [Lachnospiraceae bacterium]|nr:hypothetical protein [Lachnospiraceae bacterium]